jgi:predicted alpha/beta hydrolase family esterase
MKRAVILHGTDGKPDSNWFPWLKEKLETEGYEVWVPELPENHTPNREVYNNFLFGQGWDFADNIVIGHSSGAVSVLNLFMDERCPKVQLGVMVGAWAGGVPNGYPEDTKDFDNLFPPEGFNFELIKNKAEKLAFLHGDNDPYCPLEQAQYLAEKLDASLTVIPNGGHLGRQYTELPELWGVIEKEIG